MGDSFFRRAGSTVARVFASAADPTAEPDKILLYSLVVSGLPQMFARTSDGTIYQLTPPDTATQAIVVYRPGLPTSAPYYQTWAEIETAVNAVDGACQLWVDQTGFGGYAPVPATANLDGKGRLEIVGKGPGGEAGLTFADGAQIRNVQTFRTIVLRGQGSVTPPLLWDLDGMIVECYDATFLFAAVCAQPVMKISVPSYISFFFSHSSELRNGGNPGAAVMFIDAPVLCFLCIDTLFFPSTFNTTIGGAVGSTLEMQTDFSLPPTFNLPAFLGTFTLSCIDNAPNGLISVANLAALALVDPTTATRSTPRGVIVLTLPSTQPFMWNPASTLAPDGITTVAAIGGGNWERQLGPPSPDAQAQTDWFIDPVGGNDENTGLTALTALKTHAELQRRWGSYGTLLAASTITVTIVSDLATTDPIVTTGLRLGAGQLLVYKAADAAVLAAPTAFNVTPQNPATNTPWSIQGNGGAFNFAPYVGNRVRVVGGPNNGATFTILDTTGGGLTAIIDAPVTLPTSSPLAFGVGISAVTAGDALQIIQQVKVEVDQIQMTFALDEPAAGSPFLTFDNLELGGTYWDPVYPQGQLIGCKVTCGVAFEALNTVFAYGTHFTGTPSVNSDSVLVLNAGSCVTAFAGNAALVGFGGSLNFDADVVLYGGGFVAEGGFHQVAQLAVFNASAGFLNTGAGISMITSNSSVQTFGSIYGASRIWGANNAMGVSVPPGGTFDSTVASTKTITGAGGDFQLATQTTGRAWDEGAGAYTTARACSWANLTALIGGGGFSGNAHDVATMASAVE